MKLNSRLMSGRLVAVASVLTLVGSVGVFSTTASAGEPSEPPANSALIADCISGPYVYGEIRPVVVKSLNCLSIKFMTDEPMTNGTVEVTLPKGISITKKIAGPRFNDDFDTGCTWGGGFSLKNGRNAQIVTLKGVTCETLGDNYFVAFFAATISVPLTITYIPFTAHNISWVAAAGTCGALSRIFGDSVYNLIGPPVSGYPTSGTFTLSSRGGGILLDTNVIQVVQDSDYYNWLNWYYNDFSSSNTVTPTC